MDLTLQVNSVNTGTAAFNKHLQSPDLFDAAQFPTVRFVGDKFSFNGDKVTQVAGNLTLRGKTQPVTLKALNYGCYDHPMLKRQVCGGDFETTIDRTAFGVGKGDFAATDQIPAQVTIRFAFSAHRPATR